MSTSSRLQFVTDELVRTRKLGAIEYAAGQSILYGATCPGRDVPITIASPGDPNKTLSLKIHKPRCPYLFIAFTRVSLSGGMVAADVSLKIWGSSTITLASSIPSWAGAQYVYRKLMKTAVFPLSEQTDVSVGLEVSGVHAGTVTVRDFMLLGLPSSDMPPLSITTPTGSS